MTRPLVYHQLAHLWPLLSGPDDYATEARCIYEILQRYLLPTSGRRRICELGSGAGHLLWHLTKDYDVTAVDLSQAMLDQSKVRNPDVRHERGDMRSVRLGGLFDAVLAHDAIDYMCNEDDLHATFATAAAHLRRGGVFLLAPTYLKSTFVDHQVASQTRRDQQRQVTCVSYVHRTDARQDMFELVMLLLIHEAGKLRVAEDRHRCGLFDQSTWVNLLENAGFAVQIPKISQMPQMPKETADIPGYLFVAVKR